ncbi:MAG TPA: hypothetical protein ENI69_01240 [Rhodospirillales bacterium]|nr:hypothetical protein [Rhodospirillales bacterium]
MTEERELLKLAQEKLQQLQEENEHLSTSFFELMDAQKAEAEQMVQLTEQLWAVESALAESKEKALEQMGLMKSKIESVSAYVQDTLVAADKNASSMELAARVYELGQMTDLEEIDQKIAEFNDNLEMTTKL